MLSTTELYCLKLKRIFTTSNITSDDAIHKAPTRDQYTEAPISIIHTVFFLFVFCVDYRLRIRYSDKQFRIQATVIAELNSFINKIKYFKRFDLHSGGIAALTNFIKVYSAILSLSIKIIALLMRVCLYEIYAVVSSLTSIQILYVRINTFKHSMYVLNLHIKSNI